MATLIPDASLFRNAKRARSADYVRVIFDREMGVTLHNAQVGSPRDDAMRELTKATTNLYAKRVLRELIQNAFDGASGAGAARILVRLDLREGVYGTLYVANSGEGFTELNVDAISNPALSDKRPGNFIGHKGLGFRSVELLSDDTQIFSVADVGQTGAVGFDGFCFRFAAAEDERAWLGAKRAMEHAEKVVGRTHRLQLPLPIDEDPPDVADFAREGFATLVRLPLRDELAAARALEEIRLLIDEKAPITLFLDELSSLALETIDRASVVEPKVLTRTSRNRRALPRGRGLTLEEVTVDRRRFFLASMSVDEAAFRASVERAVKQRHPVEKWREWVGAPLVSAALPLSADAKAGSFYAFLPMDTAAPFNGCLDAPFFPNADRRDLDLSNPLNAFLLDSVADLCLAVADEIASANEGSLELACAAVDALAWCRDANRLIRACERAGMEVGALRLPTVRRKVEKSRWARLDAIFDWDDASRRIIDGAWLVQACDVPMLRRGIGQKRLKALHEFVDGTEFTFDPEDSNWAEWGPALAADLNMRRKVPRQAWELFYTDLAAMPGVLPHLRGKKIFRIAEGALGAANSPENLGQREFFISPESETPSRRPRRVAGTALFPPPSVAKRMEFADPSLGWTPPVAKAIFEAGLATEFSLAKVISGIGRLLGSRPSKTVLLAALRWTFAAWFAHKSPEVHSGTSKGPGGASELKIRQQTTSGWRAFTGSRLVNAEVPRTLKILRLGSWAEHPVIRMDFTSRRGAAVHCLVPLFSGGTLMRWGEDDCLTEMIPCEPKSAALVGSLCNSMRHEMSAIVQWASGSDESEAMRTIMQSRDDPWAAVAAGLLLVGSGRVKQVGSWPQRFAARHAWLSDFGVLGAWWQAANQPHDEKDCLALLKQARERGHIYFWNSFPLSEQLLTALSSSAKSTELRAEARKELGRWKRMQSGAVRVGAFPIWVTAT